MSGIYFIHILTVFCSSVPKHGHVSLCVCGPSCVPRRVSHGCSLREQSQSSSPSSWLRSCATTTTGTQQWWRSAEYSPSSVAGREITGAESKNDVSCIWTMAVIKTLYGAAGVLVIRELPLRSEGCWFKSQVCQCYR